VEIALRKDYTEANASISFYITEMSLIGKLQYIAISTKQTAHISIIEGKSIPFSVLERLTQVTYFDRRELKLLYRAFMRAVSPKRSISPDLFRRIFPEFDNPLLLRSVFNAFDVRERADDEISFSEFVEVLSIMVRGSMSERAHRKYCTTHTYIYATYKYLPILVAFRICDLNKDGAVEREEVLQVYQQVVRAMHKSGLSTESYSDPRNLVRSVSAPNSTSP
jgi:Ca2+-binding EF-hand superfamily protein